MNWGSLLSSTRFNQVMSKIHFLGLGSTAFRSSAAPPVIRDKQVSSNQFNRIRAWTYNHYTLSLLFNDRDLNTLWCCLDRQLKHCIQVPRLPRKSTRRTHTRTHKKRKGRSTRTIYIPLIRTLNSSWRIFFSCKSIFKVSSKVKRNLCSSYKPRVV